MAMLEQRERFTHDQLDTTQQSIRVIDIYPELLLDGLVQCRIRHTNVDAQYNCLSYRWGSPDFSHTLIVDGKQLSISQSLHKLLTAVRTFTYREPVQFHEIHLRESLWVDAICIDQESKSEKVHKVAQMGKTYSNATKVMMWLGNNHGISLDMLPKATMADFVDFVWLNEYWTRAWVAHEVILAKDPVLMIANHLTSFPDFVRDHIDVGRVKVQGKDDREKRSWLSEDTMYLSTRGVLRAWMRCADLVRYSIKPGITEWLSELQDVNCTLVHDRVFSLFELAEDGRRIPIDYSISPSELIYRVLKARDHGVCLCKIYLLNHLLRVWDKTSDSSKACVYAQWILKPQASAQLCPSIMHALGFADYPAHSKPVDNPVSKIVQVPLQKLTTWRLVEPCHGAITGKIAIPV